MAIFYFYRFGSVGMSHTTFSTGWHCRYNFCCLCVKVNDSVIPVCPLFYDTLVVVKSALLTGRML